MNVNLNDINLILNGAAITIQTAWRKFKFCQNFELVSRLKKLKSNFQLNETNVMRSNSEIYFDCFSNNCLKNDFLCDVRIIVNTEVYFCHSVVLYCYSRYFRNLFEKYDGKQQDYKFQLLVSNECWEIVQKYMYGYHIKIPKRLFEELENVAKELKIDALRANLIDLLNTIESNQTLENLNKNQNCNSISNSSISISSSDYSQKQEYFFLGSNQPFQLISNYYKFFKCVINFYRHDKLSFSKALFYLSTNYIDYKQMEEKQLYKCILMLKTYLKLQNSDLILDIINIYLNKKND